MEGPAKITGACMKELGYETINAMFRTEGIIVVCPYTGVSKANVDGTCISSIRDEHGQPFITCSWIQYLP